MIISGKNRYIVGQFSRLGSVETLYSLLVAVLPNIFRLTEWGFDAISLLMNLSKDDCIILFSFGRLTQLESEVIAAAKKTGARFLVITDRMDTPAAQGANIRIYSRANAGFPFYSSVCNTLIIEILADLISEKTWATSKNRLANVDMQIAALSKPESSV